MASDAPVAPPDGLEPLQLIADNTYLFEPDVSDAPVDGPSLILISTWAGGSTPRRVSKYTARYRELWPSAAILVIMSRPRDLALLPTRVVHSNLAPAREVVRRHVDARLSEKKGPSILLHIFSNGGLFMAVNLLQTLRAGEWDKGRAPLDLSPHNDGIVLDCTPGRTGFRRLYKAALVVMPKSPLVARALGQAFSAIVLSTLVFGQRMGVFPNDVDTLRERVNDPRLFGSTRRLYLYSRADLMVPWKDVESHIEETRSKAGLAVESERYEDAKHCALIADDSERYWDAIRGFWQRAEAEGLVRRARRSRL